jgi:hypothetical protein
VSNGQRRSFLLTGGEMVVGALAAGTLIACGSSRETNPTIVHAQGSANLAVFGWEINNLNGGGAAAYFKVQSNLVLNLIDMDVCFCPLSLPQQPGLTEVLCRGQVSRGAPPVFNTAGQLFFPPSSPAFGPLQTLNPGGLQIGMDSQPFQDTFISVILKSWVPGDGTAAATYRHLQISPSISLSAGDYLVFTMNGGEITLDAEMQVILGFQ